MDKIIVTFDIKEAGKYLVVSEEVTWKGLCQSATLYNGKRKKKVGAKNMEMQPGINTVEMELDFLDFVPDCLFKGTDIVTCVIPEGATEIGREVFADCRKLTTVSLPSTLKRMGGKSFHNCHALSAVDFPAAVEYACGAFEGFHADRINYAADMKILPEGMFACYKNTRETIVIPEGITTIGKEAFREAKVSSIKFPSTLTTIEPGAFERAEIGHMEWPDNVPVTFQEQAKLNGDGFCELCYMPLAKDVETLVIDDDYNCDTLIVPACVKKIVFGGYGYPMHLNRIWVDPANTVYDSRENCNAVIETATGVMILAGAHTTVPEGVTEIAKSAEGIVKAGVCPKMPSTLQKVSCDFRDFNEITLTPVLIKALDGLACFKGKLIVSSDVRELNGRMVKARWSDDTELCSYFKECEFTEIVLAEGLETIGSHCFERCTLKSNLVLPQSLKTIGAEALSITNGNKKNEEGMQEPLVLTIAEGMTELTTLAFAGMTGFKTSIPDSVTTIEKSAFANWYPANVTLPQNLEVLNDLFAPTKDRGSKHSSLVIPASVKALGESAGDYGRYSSLNDCDTITCLPATAPTLPEKTIDHLTNGTLCYPKGADYSAWKETFKGWKFNEI